MDEGYWRFLSLAIVDVGLSGTAAYLASQSGPVSTVAIQVACIANHEPFFFPIFFDDCFPAPLRFFTSALWWDLVVWFLIVF